MNEFTGGHITTPPYISVDNPAGAGTVVTGTWYASSGNGTEDDLVRITLASSGTFRLGVLVDHHDFTDISPSSLRLRQTTGGAANSGLQASNGDANRNGDWYFFDVTGVAGDVFVLSGVNWFNGSPAQTSNGIGALTFDSAVPEPSTFALAALASGLLALGRRRKR